jgi:putative addiction module component (TIGR02574 family)
MSMPSQLPQIDIGAMTVGQRLDLIGQLWDSIPEPVNATDLPEWHRAEIERRLKEADAAPQKGIPWEEVKKRLRRQE